MPAVRARHVIMALVAALKFVIDARGVLHRWRTDQQHLAAREIRRAALDQAERVALAADLPGEIIDLVAHHVLDRHRAQARPAVCPRQHQQRAGEVLDVLAVRRIALAPAGQTAQRLAVGQHRVQALQHPALAHLERRQHHQHRAERAVHVVTDPVQSQLGQAGLGRLHDHDPLHRRAVAQAIHDLAQVWRARGLPLTRLAAALAAQDAMRIGPFRHRQARAWPRRPGKAGAKQRIAVLAHQSAFNAPGSSATACASSASTNSTASLSSACAWCGSIAAASSGA